MYVAPVDSDGRPWRPLPQYEAERKLYPARSSFRRPEASDYHVPPTTYHLEGGPEAELHDERLECGPAGAAVAAPTLLRLPEVAVALVQIPCVEVGPIEQVEHLEQRLEREPVVESESSRNAQVHAVQVFPIEVVTRDDRAIRARAVGNDTSNRQ